jgi:cellulose synthase/poly-beta-1,6-N-acetylglucosamine synthase-like glycosyltransferase
MTEMHEYVCLIMSSLLFAYAIRMLIFLHAAWKHYSKSIQITLPSPAVSTLKSVGNGKGSSTSIFHQNVVLNDYVRFSASVNVRQGRHYSSVEDKSIKKSNYAGTNLTGNSNSSSDTVVSIIVATNNEESVIGGLLKSVNMLTYNRDRFEIIVVDDSIDSTTEILEEWKKRMKNLKIIRRRARIGSKGGALNLALEVLRKDSTWAIIIDADTIVPPDIIEQFLLLLNGTKEECHVFQGYCIPYNNYLNPNVGVANWVSKGVEFRLAQRNMIELIAKNKLNLPIQITGNLFMIKTSILRELRFSTDICEDWELTLSLYLRGCESGISSKGILFLEKLNACNQVPTSFISYFKQRLRVSEGHTRGFIKAVPKLIVRKQPLKDTIEFFFTGFRYLQSILILSVLLIDSIGMMVRGVGTLEFYLIMSLLIQIFCISTAALVNVLGLNICSRSKQYTFIFLISKLVIEICTLPALVFGSLAGFFRKKGSFHRTLRITGNANNSSYVSP